MSRRVVLVALAAVALLAVAAGLVVAVRGDDAPPPGWRAPDAAPAPPGAFASAAVAGDGTVIAAWTELHHGLTAIRTSERPPGGAWSAPETVLAPQGWRAGRADVTAGPRGDAVVTWSLVAHQKSILFASRRPAGGAWETPQALAPVTRGIYDARAAVAGDGRLTVAWWDVLSRAGMAASSRVPSAPWSDGVPVGSASSAGSPRIAIGPDGTAWIATIGLPRPGLAPVHVYARGAGASGWTALPAPPGPSAGRGTLDAALAIDGRGRPVLAWTTAGRGDGAALHRATWLGGRWSAPRVLDRAPSAYAFGALAAAPAGDGVTVAWIRWQRMWTRVAVRAARDGDVRTLAAFDIPDMRADSPHATPGPPPGGVLLADGPQPAALWSRLVGRTPQFTSTIESSRGLPDGSWSPPEAVSPAPAPAYPVAIGRSGEGLVAAWGRFPETRAGGLRILAADRIG